MFSISRLATPGIAVHHNVAFAVTNMPIKLHN